MSEINIKALLAEHGCRVTGPRLRVMGVLATHEPRSVQEIAEVLHKKRVRIDLASIYRTVKLLVEMGIVAELDLGGGMKRYEIVDPASHHHHLVCERCGAIEDVVIEDEHALIESVTRHTKFQVNRHMMEFFGVCPRCQKATSC